VRVALDTNVLAYAEGVGDAERLTRAVNLVRALPGEIVVLPAQVLGELYRVLSGKARRDVLEAREAIQTWADTYEVVDSTWSALASALDLSVDHGLQIWDALILSVAAENRCRLLLSEDLQRGFTWRGVTVVDPFSQPGNPILDSLLAG
jgi:predicted nucleic acid-binding protein